MKIDCLLIYVFLLYTGIRYLEHQKTRFKSETRSLDKEIKGFLHISSSHYNSGLRLLDIKSKEKVKPINGRSPDWEQLQEQIKGDVIGIEKNIGMLRKYDYD